MCSQNWDKLDHFHLKKLIQHDQGSHRFIDTFNGMKSCFCLSDDFTPE